MYHDHLLLSVQIEKGVLFFQLLPELFNGGFQTLLEFFARFVVHSFFFPKKCLVHLFGLLAVAIDVPFSQPDAFVLEIFQ